MRTMYTIKLGEATYGITDSYITKMLQGILFKRWEEGTFVQFFNADYPNAYLLKIPLAHIAHIFNGDYMSDEAVELIMRLNGVMYEPAIFKSSRDEYGHTEISIA